MPGLGPGAGVGTWAPDFNQPEEAVYIRCRPEGETNYLGMGVHSLRCTPCLHYIRLQWTE